MLGAAQIYVLQVRLVNPNLIDILNAGHFRNGEVVVEELFVLGVQMGSSAISPGMIFRLSKAG